MKNHPYLAYSKGDTKENILGHLRKQIQRQRCTENKGERNPVIMKAHLFSNSSTIFLLKLDALHSALKAIVSQSGRDEDSRLCSQIFKFLIILLLRFLLSNKRTIYHFSSGLAIFHCRACCKPHRPT